MTTTKKLPVEIRRMKRLGRYSAAMAYNGRKAAATWRVLKRSTDPAAPELIRQLVQVARESILQFEAARAACADMGCLLVPDPNWQPPDEF